MYISSVLVKPIHIDESSLSRETMKFARVYNHIDASMGILKTFKSDIGYAEPIEILVEVQ